MENILTFAIILPVLPDGAFVFQRRSTDAPYAPGTLGFFGGWIEDGETPKECIDRELQEETDLQTEGLELELLSEFVVPASQDFDKNRRFHLFTTNIQDLHFKVFEGDGAEAVLPNEITERSDLAHSAKYFFREVRPDLSGTKPSM